MREWITCWILPTQMVAWTIVLLHGPGTAQQTAAFKSFSCKSQLSCCFFTFFPFFSGNAKLWRKHHLHPERERDLLHVASLTSNSCSFSLCRECKKSVVLENKKWSFFWRHICHVMPTASCANSLSVLEPTPRSHTVASSLLQYLLTFQCAKKIHMSSADRFLPVAPESILWLVRARDALRQTLSWWKKPSCHQTSAPQIVLRLFCVKQRAKLKHRKYRHQK